MPYVSIILDFSVSCSKKGAYMQKKGAYIALVTRAQRGQTFTPLKGTFTTGNPLWIGDQRGVSIEGLVG